jgi:hypothetical protein
LPGAGRGDGAARRGAGPGDVLFFPALDSPSRASGMGGAMRLTRDQVETVSQRLVHALMKEGTISTEEPGAIIDLLSRVFTEDLAVEDRLNLEVRELMDKYGEEITRGDINYQEMFRKIKTKLARERGIIL